MYIGTVTVDLIFLPTLGKSTFCMFLGVCIEASATKPTARCYRTDRQGITNSSITRCCLRLDPLTHPSELSFVSTTDNH